MNEALADRNYRLTRVRVIQKLVAYRKASAYAFHIEAYIMNDSDFRPVGFLRRGALESCVMVKRVSKLFGRNSEK